MGKTFTNFYALKTLARLLRGYPFDKAVITRLQLTRLKKLLLHSYRNFEFYRTRMDECGFDPHQIRDISELEQLPVLTKEEYRSFTDDLLEKNPEKYQSWYFDKTSGSTGIPLEIVRSWPERGYMIAKWLRELYLNGYRCTDHSFRTVVPSRIKPGKEVFLQRFGLFKRSLVPYFLSPREMAEAYSEAQPDFLYCSQVEAVLIAKYILENGLEIKKPRIYSIGGAILDKNSRELFSAVFGSENFFETYACEETGVLAFQLKGTPGLTFSHDTNILELQDRNGSINKESGNCLITDLGIYSFPLIRYQLGDYIQTSVDDNGLRKIDRIIGRLDDWLIWADGSRSGMGYFYEIMGKFSSGISQFRIIQESYEYIRILVVPSPLKKSDALPPRVMAGQIVDGLKKHLRPDVEYHVEFVNQIPPDKNGKLRIIVSKIKQGE